MQSGIDLTPEWLHAISFAPLLLDLVWIRACQSGGQCNTVRCCSAMRENYELLVSGAWQARLLPCRVRRADILR